VQNSECLPLFPVPLPRPGFYGQSLTQFTSCVPAAACPGVDAAFVSSLYQAATPMQRTAMLQQYFSVAYSANATSNFSVGAPRQARARPSCMCSHAACAPLCHDVLCRGLLCVLCALILQVGSGGSNATTSIEGLRQTLLGYLNVTTVDCAPGECVRRPPSPVS
jgi:hypothetical protein